ncbi:HNH endonuclease signature motif containing protein [Desulfobacter sp.]|uniref:HNH endonuclease signature motif containing protein n=1 Tax=Desulfobacter sp. TaxID=2294 RepID=UPI003D09F8F6
MFTEDRERFINSTFKSHTAEETARLVNARFDMAVTGQQIKTYVKNHGIASGRTGHFPKGNKPWNAGSKGQGLTGPNKGSFKKGDIPGNTKPLGYERIDSKDGYVLVKVAEPNPHTGAATRFKHKHIHIYEQEHGPVPEGMVVIFRDGDRRNFDPGNLEAITRSELARLNQYGYSHVPDELKPSVLAMTKLKVKVFERSKERS